MSRPNSQAASQASRPFTAPDTPNSSGLSGSKSDGSLNNSSTTRRRRKPKAKQPDPFARRKKRTGMSNPGPGSYEVGHRHTMDADRLRQPSYGFGTAHRWNVGGKLYAGKEHAKSSSTVGAHSPGPAMYMTRDKVRRSPSTLWKGGTFPSSANRPSSVSVVRSPGPIYWPTLDNASGFKKGPSYSVGTGHKNMFDREPGYKDSPGPGYLYELNSYKPRAPKHIISKRLDKPSDSKSDLPGPATYGYASSMDDVSMNSERAPAYSCAERLGPLGQAPDKLKVPRDPGPGPEYVSHLDAGKTMQSITFSKDERFWDEEQQSAGQTMQQMRESIIADA